MMKNLISLATAGSLLIISPAYAVVGLTITFGGLPMSTTLSVMNVRRENENSLLLRATLRAQEYVELEAAVVTEDELADYRAELLQDPIFKAALEVIRQRRKNHALYIELQEQQLDTATYEEKEFLLMAQFLLDEASIITARRVGRLVKE